MRHGPLLIGVDHSPDHNLTTNYTPEILSCYIGYWNQEHEPWTSSVVLGSNGDDDAGMGMVSHHFMSVL